MNGMKELEKRRGWDERLGDQAVLELMRFLKEYTESYQGDMRAERTRFEEERKSLEAENKSKLDAIEQARQTRIKDAEATRDSIRRTSSAQSTDIANYKRSVEGFVTENPVTGMFTAPSAGVGRLLEETQAKMVNSYNGFGQENATYLNKVDQYVAAVARRADAEADLARTRENLRYTEVSEAAKAESVRRVVEIKSYYRNVLAEMANEKRLKAFKNRVKATRPDARDFQCAEGLPEYVYLGETSMELLPRAELYEDVAHEIEEAIQVILPHEGRLTVELPYGQSLDDGISLFTSYSPRERALYQEHMRRVLLRLFMGFPAGKLEATMIDPLELGETFAMFTKLGEEQSRIINTKIWSQEKDITECINTLRRDLENMTQAYGDDKEARLKKEPIRALMITDFPTGFSPAALRDLQAVVRKSAAFGVCVFIWSNEGEVEKLGENNRFILNEIKDMLHVATAGRQDALLEGAVTERDVHLALAQDTGELEYSVEILNKLARGISGAQRKIESFMDMYDDIENPGNWLMKETINEYSVPVGIKGASTVVNMVLGKRVGTEHHGLIAGQTGAGKSTLLHTIIMGTLLNYPPDEVQFYLVDFKEGVEFKQYTRYHLPGLRVIAIDSEPEFGLNILKELCEELERRADTFSRAGYEEIADYRLATKERVPKIVLLFDEVQELFRDRSESDALVKESLSCLSKLLTQGRALGIHVILASQDFRLAPGLESLFSLMAVRIAIKGSEGSASSVLSSDNPGAKQLQDRAAGAAVYNGSSGVESGNNFFQVAYLDKEKRENFLGELSRRQSEDGLPTVYGNRARVLLTNAEDDVSNIFNQFIIRKKAEKLYDDEKKYGLVFGEGFDLYNSFKSALEPVSRSNILMVGQDEAKATSIFCFIMLSLLYNEMAQGADVQKDNQLVALVDLSAREDALGPDITSFKHMESQFPKQIKRAGLARAKGSDVSGMEEMISDVYDLMMARKKSKSPVTERVALMVFGLNRAHRLASANSYEEEDANEMSVISKLRALFQDGAKYGINCVVWGENLKALKAVAGGDMERNFAQRVVFSTDTEALEQLAMEYEGASLRPSTGVYINVDEDVKNTHFRSYKIPDKVWVEKIANVYRELEGK